MAIQRRSPKDTPTPAAATPTPTSSSNAVTLGLGPVSLTIPGIETSTASETSSGTRKSSTSTSITSTSSFSSSTSSTSSLITSSLPSSTSQFPTFSTATPSSSSATSSSSTSHHLSTGLTAFVVIAVLALLGAGTYLILMRRHLKQREWTFQQHQRIFEQSGKFGADNTGSKRKSRLSQWFRPGEAPPPEYYGNFGGGPLPPMPPLPNTGESRGNRAWEEGMGPTVVQVGEFDRPVQQYNNNFNNNQNGSENPVVGRKPVPPPKKEYPQKQRVPDDSYRVQRPAEAMGMGEESYELGRRG